MTEDNIEELIRLVEHTSKLFADNAEIGKMSAILREMGEIRDSAKVAMATALAFETVRHEDPKVSIAEICIMAASILKITFGGETRKWAELTYDMCSVVQFVSTCSNTGGIPDIAYQ